MANHDDAALRQAADRIMAERPRWEGVGLLVLENLDTGACSIVLIPADAPRPDWTDELLHAGGWDRHEDLNLATWLQRWGAAIGADGTMRRWGEWTNLLHLHVPTALVAAMPAAQRRLACGHGLGVHAAPPVQGASELLGRLVAWLLPWERLAVGDGRQACAHWLGPRAVLQQWRAIGLVHGAGGRTAAERTAGGGLVEWGVLAAWPSTIDAVVAFLLAQADGLDAMPRTPAAGAPAPRQAHVGAAGAERWREVQQKLVARMNRDRPAGKPCPSMRELGRELACSHRTVGKAFKDHAGLKAWRAESEYGARKTAPAARALHDGDAAELKRLVAEQSADNNYHVRKRA